MMQPLRLGFIGAGVMATWAIYPALHFAPLELVAICDLDEARAAHAAKTFGAKQWYAVRTGRDGVISLNDR
jgi:predicted dehydrogenase